MTLRTLHVTHQYAPAIGGSERYITDLSEELAQRGHEVAVFTSQSCDYHTWRSQLPPFEVRNGVYIHRFSSWQRGPHTWRLLEWGLSTYHQTRSSLAAPAIFLGNGPVSSSLFWALLRRVRGYDLIHINQLHYAHAWTAYLAARIRGVPIVLTPHIHVEQPETYDVNYLWRILRGSDAVLAVTRAEQEFLQRQLPDQAVVQGGNGLSLARFPPRDAAKCRQRLGLPVDSFVLLFLGRKTEYKGLSQLLAAFVTLRRQHPNLYLLAVGPETTYSQMLWRQYGELDGLVVHGAVDEEQRLDALAACDVLALPSTGEAFGIVYLEAWAYSKPVIGANIQSVASLIDDGMDGFVIDPLQPGQLLAAIQALISNQRLAHHMGRQGNRKLHRRYTIGRIAGIVEGVYLRTLRRARTRVGEGVERRAQNAERRT